MRKTGVFTVVAFVLFSSAFGFAQRAVIPTTTMAMETGNNTSTADSFQGQSNGNATAGNVSKVDIRTLLYPGSTTAIYAHFMPWFGKANHADVGYSTANPNQAAKTVDDMMSRGIQGVIVDWYGRNRTHEDQSTIAIFQEAQKRGFKFAIMEDAGALKADNKTGELIADLIYANQKFQQSSNYMRINGRPVVFFFGVEALPIDWDAVRNQVPGNPLFVFQNSVMFAKSYADGAFSWVGSFGNANDWGQAYLSNFYKTAKNSPKRAVGSVKKGFDDRLAGWGQNRVINQRCGTTWLETFAEVNRNFHAGQQLETLQIVTWNDYEEGTAIEMGIDNCVSVSGSASGDTLSWNISGDQKTIHHFTVFISQDGKNLMSLGAFSSDTRSVDMRKFDMASGAYTVYVKAVGKPSMLNKMSGPIGYTSKAATAVLPPAEPGVPSGAADLAMSLTQTSMEVSRGSSASTTVVMKPSGDFRSKVKLNCGNLPAGVNCSFEASEIVPGKSTISTKLTIKANGDHLATAGKSIGTFAIWMPGLAVCMVMASDRRRGKRLLVALGLATILLFAMGMTGCGGAAKFASDEALASAPSQPGTYTVNVVAQSGSWQKSTSATITIR
ncbi:MAG TPA: endo-1,3-alpha-glucanase family glycosylhydrolase [Terriglobales bacterium]|nr:endo-1,3-alpha-glucanase family glycosylhydrolase [Terriglobales bacterium]